MPAAEEEIRPYERTSLSKDYLRALAAGKPVTLLTATRNFDLNQAAVLARLLREAEQPFRAVG